MTNQRRTSRLTIAVLFVLVYALIGSLVATAVATNTLGAGDRVNGIIERVRLAIDPPPDREIQPTVEVTAPPRNRDDDPDLVAQLPGVDSERTPKPERKPVDVRLRLNPGRAFASQHTADWCAVAGTQMVLAIHGLMDNSVDAQRRLANGIDKWESWRDSHNGGWGPAAIAQALADHGLPGYEIRSYGSRQLALRDSAIALSRTKAPVVLISWKGAHTWVMTGFRANADPTIFRNAKVTGTYIYDPWYPRVSSIWGASDPPGTFQDEAEMVRNFLRWNRPEGDYLERDGKFIAVVPTITQKDQPLIRR
jgi:hypothetical protein